MAEPIPAISSKRVDIIFGRRPELALALVDAGASREGILERTGQVLGVAGTNPVVGEGEICGLIGLSGSGKATLLRVVNGPSRVTRGRVLVRDGNSLADVASCDALALRRLRTRHTAPGARAHRAKLRRARKAAQRPDPPGSDAATAWERA